MSKAVEIKNLTYKFPEHETPALKNIELSIPWNTRTLLIGCNGAGKSTLLRLISGKHLCLNGNILVNGLDPFSPTSMDVSGEEECQNTTYLGTEWCHMNIINRDIGILELLNSIGYQHFKERGDKLIDMLSVDLTWRMHRLSDGQKRRVQLIMGLLKPWRVLLLDEVTVDLDVIARSKLLDFLKWETETRKCSVIYATHIFDGLAEWPNYVIHINGGEIVQRLDYAKDVSFSSDDNKKTKKAVTTGNTPGSVSICKVDSLHPLALAWLRGDIGEATD
ncbi:hypothetical protein TBLA_0D02530 [Henningerozyma blattae CBS 6284]|uniref:ABC transporter domain-containing protein n=1 Tax=Henningerozyma blattae (strain ATCC 34711 / CBS 6284 / DSM 70876 / NBRC 10599 / NRRL Y-10934 / UCD 77-7) TaxID=1071380 RepID=I2H304_HENB6|nr:hypothetical protein TBLA_0D02530 [Tetrapisispora blattae CBS 6284]CCH60756.1 hypothetical protein TBLA_0D02530 [Tetrapisispora blattae CBS 6284]